MAPRKLFDYSKEAMENALKAIREEGMAVSTASKKFNVPRTSVRNRLSGRTADECRNVGPSCVLGKSVEEKLVKWILQMADRGFPVNREGLLYSVQKIITECKLTTNFSNNTPGRKWYDSFLKRHPEVSQKKAEFINKARAAVTEESIKKWFRQTRELLGDDIQVLNHPSRIFNMDETAMFLSPKGVLVLGPKGKGVYDVGISDKDNVTTLITVSAEGEIVSPMTIFKFQRLPKIYPNAAPKNWVVAISETGWMQSKQFFEYFANIFVKYFEEKNIQKPVVVFVDGHSSHLSMDLSTLCRSNGIILICLPPNTTHMLQPLDVAFFFPLKQAWRKFITYRFSKSPQEKKGVFEQVANDLCSNGFGVNAEQCQAKWKSLMRSYKVCKDHKSKTGRGPAHFNFFEQMDLLLGSKPSNKCSHTLEANEETEITVPTSSQENEQVFSESESVVVEKPKRRRANQESSDLKTLIVIKKEEYKRREERHQEKCALEGKKIELLSKILDKQ